MTRGRFQTARRGLMDCLGDETVLAFVRGALGPAEIAEITAHLATCTDVFDGGFGYYFDAVFPKTTRHKFTVGEQCEIPDLGPKCLADFVSYPKPDGAAE